MSSIPSSAMPHASPQPEPKAGKTASEGRFAQLSEFGSGLVDKVREHPRTAAVAGAAVVGLAAAAAYPAIRGRGRGGAKGSSRSKKK